MSIKIQKSVYTPTKPQEEVKVEKTVVEDTSLQSKRQPSSEWLSIKDSDYVSHSIK